MMDSEFLSFLEEGASLDIRGKAIKQFNWRRHWGKKVAPHLDKELIQRCLDLGMTMIQPRWERGDPPYLLGRAEGRRAVPGKLSWYRPCGRCHWIAFFSLAIGVMNYPDLDWRFVSGDLHTVPVGYGPDGLPKVVMDILLFDSMTAEQSIALALKRRGDSDVACNWDDSYRAFIDLVVPKLRALAGRHAVKVAG